MNLNHPVHQGGPNRFIDLHLLTHIHRIGIPLSFCLQHASVNLLDKFSDMIYITYCVFISLVNITEYLLLTSLVEHLHLLVKTDARKFISRTASISRASSLWVLRKRIVWCIFPAAVLFIESANTSNDSDTKACWQLRARRIRCLRWSSKTVIILWFSRPQPMIWRWRTRCACINNSMSLLWRWSYHRCMRWFDNSTINCIPDLRRNCSCVFNWVSSLLAITHRIVREFILSRRYDLFVVSCRMWFLFNMNEMKNILTYMRLNVSLFGRLLIVWVYTWWRFPRSLI